MDREQQLRELMCEVGRRVWQREFVAANDGNFSARLPDGSILCTPTGVSKGFMRPEETVVISLDDGSVVRGPGIATSEIKMHLEIYRGRPDVGAVVHAHPPHATAFALVRHDLPKCIMPEAEVFLGDLPMIPYETPGTHEFASLLGPHLQTADAFLLASHGAVTAGPDLMQAYFRMECLDHFCRILMLTKQMGEPAVLEPQKVRELLAIRRRLGLRPDPRETLPDSRICTLEPQPKSRLTNTEQLIVEAAVEALAKRLKSPQS